MKVATLLLLPTCLALAGGTALADSMLIEYRSGKVQTLRLEESSSRIVSIMYQDETASPSSHPPSSTATIGAEASEKDEKTQQMTTGPPKTDGKKPVRIEWASPLE